MGSPEKFNLSKIFDSQAYALPPIPFTPNEVFEKLLIKATNNPNEVNIKTLANYAYEKGIDPSSFKGEGTERNGIIEKVNREKKQIEISKLGYEVISTEEFNREAPSFTRTRATAIVDQASEKTADVAKPLLTDNKAEVSGPPKKVEQKSEENSMSESELELVINPRVHHRQDAEKELEQLKQRGVAVSIVWKSATDGRIIVSGYTIHSAGEEPVLMNIPIKSEKLKELLTKEKLLFKGNVILPQIINNTKFAEVQNSAISDSELEQNAVTLTSEEAKLYARKLEVSFLWHSSDDGKFYISKGSVQLEVTENIRKALADKKSTAILYGTEKISHSIPKPVTKKVFENQIQDLQQREAVEAEKIQNEFWHKDITDPETAKSEIDRFNANGYRISILWRDTKGTWVLSGHRYEIGKEGEIEGKIEHLIIPPHEVTDLITNTPGIKQLDTHGGTKLYLPRIISHKQRASFRTFEQIKNDHLTDIKSEAEARTFCGQMFFKLNRRNDLNIMWEDSDGVHLTNLSGVSILVDDDVKKRIGNLDLEPFQHRTGSKFQTRGIDHYPLISIATFNQAKKEFQ